MRLDHLLRRGVAALLTDLKEVSSARIRPPHLYSMRVRLNLEPRFENQPTAVT